MMKHGKWVNKNVKVVKWVSQKGSEAKYELINKLNYDDDDGAVAAADAIRMKIDEWHHRGIMIRDSSRKQHQCRHLLERKCPSSAPPDLVHTPQQRGGITLLKALS